MPETYASHHDILIAGGGPVGCALALALRESGLRVLVAAGSQPVDAATQRPATGAPNQFAEGVTRPIALSHASHAYLRGLGALPADAGTPIRTIHVSQRGAFGRTLMSAAEHGLDALGYVFDIDALNREVSRAAAPCCVGERIIAWSEDGEGVLVRTQAGLSEAARATTIAAEHLRRAKVLVLADGGALGELAAGQRVHDYGQSALVGAVRASQPHQHRAWERFTPQGPLALLPYGDCYAFVWALPNPIAQQRLADGDDAFCRALQQAFGDRAGRFLQAGPRSCIPLTLRRARRIDNQAVIAIGNASQALHPVAGQGLNLGLRDVMALVDLLQMNPSILANRERSLKLVEQFAQRRWRDRASTIAATDLFVRVFSNDRPLAAAARGLALGTLDVLPPARAFLARRMMLGARAFP